MRKLVAIGMVKEGESSVASVAKHMTHSVARAQATYQNIQVHKNSVKAFKLISGKRHGEEPEAKRPKKEFFTREQEQLITQFNLGKGSKFPGIQAITRLAQQGGPGGPWPTQLSGQLTKLFFQNLLSCSGALYLHRGTLETIAGWLPLLVNLLLVGPRQWYILSITLNTESLLNSGPYDCMHTDLDGRATRSIVVVTVS